MGGKQRVFWVVLAIGAAAAASARASERHNSRHGTNISTEHDGPIDDCRQLRVTFDDVDAARAEETVSVPAPRGALRFRAPANSGIFVLGADRSDVSMTACKAAAAESDLSRIAVSFDGGDLSVRGPEGRDWVVHLIVRAPRAAGLDLDVTNGPVAVRGPEGRDWVVHLIVRAPRAAGLDLDATNGPIAVRGMTGAVTAHTQNGPLSFEDSSGLIQAQARNGPISLKACSGTVHATAVNGPVSVSGSGGDVDIDTQNGPISVKLSANRWDGRLEARARNGPLSLSLPEGFASGVSVESSGRSPFQCRAKACGEARRNWDEDSRRIEFGDSSTMVVRLSTVNGPVSIRSDRAEEE